jgi:hypothetical protein
MRIAATLCCAGVAACAPSAQPPVFAYSGELANFEGNGSVISLWVIPRSGGRDLYKLGDGYTLVATFDVAYKAEPPAAALDATGFGVSTLGLLPGIATTPEGPTDDAQLRLVAISRNHATIYKAPGGTGPAWAAAFPEGFSCGQCVKAAPPDLDTFAPIDCTFVVIEPIFTDQCHWF